jgi:hypothetical protein
MALRIWRHHMRSRTGPNSEIRNTRIVASDTSKYFLQQCLILRGVEYVFRAVFTYSQGALLSKTRRLDCSPMVPQYFITLVDPGH